MKTLLNDASPLSAGVYVVAVSGGVDSMALLHVLQQQADLQLVVGHVDHGIRSDSHKDAALVKRVSKSYSLPVEIFEAQLGPNTSEAQARKVRYEFLQTLANKHSAQAIVTAHHRDDVLETALINTMRGTSPRGLVALRTHQNLQRPLLNLNKQQIIDYAKAHNLQWREDSTNSQQTYLRNYIRHSILPKLNQQELQTIIDSQTRNTQQVDQMLTALHGTIFNKNRLNRGAFATLPHSVATALVRHHLAENLDIAYDSRLIEKIVHFAKVAKPQKSWSLSKNWKLEATKSTINFVKHA